MTANPDRRNLKVQLAKSSIDAALAYIRQQEHLDFGRQLRAIAPDARRSNPVVLLNDHGKRVYELVRKQAAIAPPGTVLTVSGERSMVRKYLCGLRDGSIVPPASPARGGVKHAKLQLNSITKFAGGGKRTIRGLANSGRTDRVGDIVEPKGGRWTLPVPLLWQHKHDQPIGWVRQIDARTDGLWITAELASGIGKADEAWAMIEAGLVDSYSIGFCADNWDPLPSGGKRFTSWSLLEVSVVTIPADAAAKIRRSAKSADGIPLHPGSVRIQHAGAVYLGER